MPAVSTITIADNVPTNHVFSPTKVNPEESSFNERTLSQTSAGQETLKLVFSEASASRATHKVRIEMAIPFEQLVDGVYTPYSTPRFIGEFILPSNLTSAQRLKVGAMVRNALAHATIKSYYETLEPVWG
jgi:hypothetical protein